VALRGVLAAVTETATGLGSMVTVLRPPGSLQVPVSVLLDHAMRVRELVVPLPGVGLGAVARVEMLLLRNPSSADAGRRQWHNARVVHPLEIA